LCNGEENLFVKKIVLKGSGYSEFVLTSFARKPIETRVIYIDPHRAFLVSIPCGAVVGGCNEVFLLRKC